MAAGQIYSAVTPYQFFWICVLMLTTWAPAATVLLQNRTQQRTVGQEGQELAQLTASN